MATLPPPEEVTRKPVDLDLEGILPVLRIVWGAGKNGRFEGELYCEKKCNKKEQDKLFGLMEHIAEHGLPSELPEVRYPFQHLKPKNLGEFRPQKKRFMFFRELNDVVVTHGFKKTRDETPPEEITRARRIEAEIKELETAAAAPAKTKGSQQ